MRILIELINGFSVGLYLTKYPLFIMLEDSEYPKYGMFKGLVVNLGFLRFKFGSVYIVQKEEGA
jgi:hypothetical protein